MTKRTHPTRQTLNSFALGALPTEETVKIEQHLNECVPCCETIVNLSSEDTFIELLKDAEAATSTNVGSHQKLSNDAKLPSALVDHPRYEIEKVVGCGGMGRVYKARHRMMDRSVALKIIHPERLLESSVVDRFRQEVKTAAQMHHPNIVTAFDAEKIGDFQVLVMEFVEGADLAQIVNHHGPLSIPKACEFAMQAAEGLQYAHDRGMVHRDVKPHNLIVTQDEVVKILDFGLASLPHSTSGDSSSRSLKSNLTLDGIVMGTPDFISPEQTIDARNVDGRSDIYSLGMTLYFLLTGQVPFPGEKASVKLQKQATAEPQALIGLRKEVPEEVQQVFAQMTAKNPVHRYQTPAAVVTALRPFALSTNRKPKPEPKPLNKVRTIARSAILAILVISILGEAYYFLSDQRGGNKRRAESKHHDQNLKSKEHQRLESLFATGKRNEEKGEIRKGAASYLEAYKLSPRSLKIEHLQTIKRGGMVEKLVEVQTDTDPNLYPSAPIIRALLTDESTRSLGNQLLKRMWIGDENSHYNLLSHNPNEVWTYVKDIEFYLRSKLLPSNIASEGNGWSRFKIEGIYELSEEPGWGYPLTLRCLLGNKPTLRKIAGEVEAAIEQNPNWHAGLAVLCFLEAQIGNDRAVDILKQVLKDAKIRPIPSDSAWVFGMSLEGISEGLDREVMKLYEISLHHRPHRVLRASAIPKLAMLYAKYGSPDQARKILNRMIHVDYDPLSSGVFCSPARRPENQNRCIQCHRGNSNLLDITVMSDHLTKIGYPVDAFISLARIDSSFSNAYSSDDAWAKQTIPNDFYTTIGRGRSKFLPAKSRAVSIITAAKVLDALESGVFLGSNNTTRNSFNASLCMSSLAR